MISPTQLASYLNTQYSSFESSEIASIELALNILRTPSNTALSGIIRLLLLYSDLDSDEEKKVTVSVSEGGLLRIVISNQCSASIQPGGNGKILLSDTQAQSNP